MLDIYIMMYLFLFNFAKAKAFMVFRIFYLSVLCGLNLRKLIDTIIFLSEAFTTTHLYVLLQEVH